jgi:hypothetical protein
MDEHWFPYIGHPDGTSRVAWFRVADGMVYSCTANPAGASTHPSFQIVDGWAYPAGAPTGDGPTFEIVGSFAYAPEGAAWYRIDRATP